MALEVQNADGTTAGANAYLSLADFKAYHDARGNAYSNDDALLEQAIVRATDYVDQRFQFRGTKLTQPQPTAFPRSGITDNDGFDVTGIPSALANATAEYALRALSAPLFQDAPAPEGGRVIDALSQKVDVLQQDITYAPSLGNGNFVMPAYPPADLMLVRAGLVTPGRTLVR